MRSGSGRDPLVGQRVANAAPFSVIMSGSPGTARQVDE